MYNNLYNNKSKHSTSPARAAVKGQRYGNLFALQSTNYESVVIASDIITAFCKTRIKAEILKKTTPRQLAQIIISSSRNLEGEGTLSTTCTYENNDLQL